jgi:hypothetical protein
VRIEFGLDERAAIALSIFDASGRLVREILREVLPAGSYERPWDARDDGGRAVGSGVYFVRLEAAGKTLSEKLVLAH